MSKDKQKKVTGITPVGIAGYAYLNKPDTKFNADGDYKTDLTLTGAETEELRGQIVKMTEEIEAETRAMLEEKLGQAKTGADKAKIKKSMESLTIQYPFTESVDDEGDPNGDFVFKFKSKAQFKDKKTGKIIKRTVKLFDAKKNPTSVAVFSGSRIKVAYELSPYYVPGTNSCGVSLRLNAVQIIELSQGGGGGNASSYGFGEEDGYEASDEETSTNTEPSGGEDQSDDSEDF